VKVHYSVRHNLESTALFNKKDTGVLYYATSNTWIDDVTSSQFIPKLAGVLLKHCLGYCCSSKNEPIVLCTVSVEKILPCYP
jgi:hypothetical protein